MKQLFFKVLTKYLKKRLFLVNLLAWATTKFGTVLKDNFLTGIFWSSQPYMRLRTELYFCRTHFDSYFSYSTYLLTYFTILCYTTLHYTILYYTILNYTILYYIILYYSWCKKSCHAYWKLMLESKIKQFYHPRSEDSLQSTHMINQGGFFGSLVAGFAFISRDYY